MDLKFYIYGHMFFNTTFPENITMLRTLLICVLVDLALSCKCIDRHRQTMFCSKEIVIKATALSRKPDPDGSIVYQVRVDKVYRKETDQLDFKDGDKIRVTTPGNSCGVNLPIGIPYLLSGDTSKGNMEIRSCDWNQMFSLVTGIDKVISLSYGFDCRCKIHDNQVNINDEEKPNYCMGLISDTGTPNRCQWLAGFCNRHSGGACRWNVKGEYPNCIPQT